MDKGSKENIIEPRFIKLPKGPYDIAVMRTQIPYMLVAKIPT